jgi:tetratricopeptide (TPR) repeat protein
LLNRYDEAIECLDKALEIEPKSTETLVNKGVCLDYLHRYEEAIQYYDVALDLDPRYSDA